MRDIKYYGRKGALVTIKIHLVDWPYGGSGVLSSTHPLVGGEVRNFQQGNQRPWVCEDGNMHSHIHQPFNRLSRYVVIIG